MNNVAQKIKVMIAGVGGASLGTEVLKSLQLAEDYEIYGCDISACAFGLYESGFTKTYLLKNDDYVANVLDACRDAKVKYLIPGGEQPMTLLGAASKVFASSGIHFLGNSLEVIALHSDKDATFRLLDEKAISTPRTIAINKKSDLDYVGLPCIVKPATGSGGSAAVFFAITADEAMVYADFITRSGNLALAQEYINEDEGEFTIGVLSIPDGDIIGSIALRRVLDAKLSVAYRGRGGIISSGYSQGRIDYYSDICQQAENIAVAIGSCGPINIQGRMREGLLLPFEINPRFSASTYLRAMAGFNEVDLLIKYLETRVKPVPPQIRPGWYLRSLTEKYISEVKII